MSILIIAEHDNQTLKIDTLKAVSAAKALVGHIGSDIHVLVVGYQCGGIAEQTSALQDISKVIIADNISYQHQLAENISDLIVNIAEDYSHILAAASTTGKNLMPRVAALLDVTQISDIIAVESSDTFIRPIYAGNAIATIKCLDEKKIITVRTTAFDPVESNGSANISPLDIVKENKISEYLHDELTISARPELNSAKIIVSGGRGMQSGDNFALLEDIADKLGAAVGASRAAVDAGYVSNDMQVGQTGKIVAPELYIAVGISGAIQHLAGMKDSKVIVAINKDPDASIFQIADYGLVDDLFNALPELESKL